MNYNFTIIQDKNTVKTVIVSGRNNDGVATSVADTDKLIVIEPKLKFLPEKYKNLPTGSVAPVVLPVKTMMAVKESSKIVLDLPMGRFNVAYDRIVNGDDGSKT